MRNIVKSRERDADDSSSFSRLPDEIILQILNNLIDLKTLCFCYLVSRRFSSIVLQIDAISFTPPLIEPSIPDKNNFRDVDGGGCPIELFRHLIGDTVLITPLHLPPLNVAPSKPLPPISSSFSGQSFRSALTFLSKFRGVKSLYIELPSSSHRGNDNDCLFKWKAKFGTRIESFMFLSPNSISVKDGYQGEEEGVNISDDLISLKNYTASHCLKEVILRHRMLMYIVKDLPMLEEVSITDSGKTGRLSLSGEKLSEVKKWVLSSAFETFKSQMYRIEFPFSVGQCHISVLDLPVSGYVMKGITVIVVEMNGVQGGSDSYKNSEDCSEDKEEAAYNEAVMQILKKHMSWGWR